MSSTFNGVSVDGIPVDGISVKGSSTEGACPLLVTTFLISTSRRKAMEMSNMTC
jgi:hypothetical protein